MGSGATGHWGPLSSVGPHVGQLSLQQPTVPPGLAVSGQQGGAQGWGECRAGSYPAEHSTLMGTQLPPGLLSQHHALLLACPRAAGAPSHPPPACGRCSFPKVLEPK